MTRALPFPEPGPDLLAQLQAAEARNAELAFALEQAAGWFTEYADHHLAKGDRAKADRNLSRAAMLRRVVAL